MVAEVWNGARSWFFSCEKDCCESRKDGWKEERVLVQWEDASLI